MVGHAIFEALTSTNIAFKSNFQHWWSIRYYSFFAVIHAIRIRSILQEQKPILLSAEEMEIFASVFQANQFTPRQFISLRKLARKKTARAHTLIKPSSVAMHSLILVIRYGFKKPKTLLNIIGFRLFFVIYLARSSLPLHH